MLHDTFSRYGRVRPCPATLLHWLISRSDKPAYLAVCFYFTYIVCRLSSWNAIHPWLENILWVSTCSVQVKAVELSPHTDYQLKATIKMLFLRQAIAAVSGLHRYKIGGKRIQVSLITGGNNKSLAMLRYSQVKLMERIQYASFFRLILFGLVVVTFISFIIQLRDNQHSSGCSCQLPSPLQIHRDLWEKVSSCLSGYGFQSQAT